MQISVNVLTAINNKASLRNPCTSQGTVFTLVFLSAVINEYHNMPTEMSTAY